MLGSDDEELSDNNSVCTKGNSYNAAIAAKEKLKL